MNYILKIRLILPPFKLEATDY